jgi:hypothetical protein
MGRVQIVRVFPMVRRWLVSYRNGEKQNSFESKEEAETFATVQARKDSPARVVVIDRHGETEYELRF